MDKVILPALTYGLETWALTKHQAGKLAAAQRSMERSIASISLKGKIRNEVIRERTRVKDVFQTARDQKSKWAGHVARMQYNRWTKTTECYPRDSKRGTGKFKRRWRNEIKEEVGNYWMRIALDRVEWKQLWRPSTSSGMTD